MHTMDQSLGSKHERDLLFVAAPPLKGGGPLRRGFTFGYFRLQSGLAILARRWSRAAKR